MEENYLVDRQDLGKFVDELIKKKSLPVNTAEELERYRENVIDSLDDSIGLAIFGQLTDDENTELSHLLDSESSTEDDFRKFFERTDIDVEQTVTDTMTSFAKAFLEEGGINE